MAVVAAARSAPRGADGRVESSRATLPSAAGCALLRTAFLFL